MASCSGNDITFKLCGMVGGKYMALCSTVDGRYTLMKTGPPHHCRIVTNCLNTLSMKHNLYCNKGS